MYDLLIKNTQIIDGTGEPAYIGSVASENGKIKLLPADTDVEAKTVIDGTDRITCPGFIDPHSHGDIPLGQTFASLSKVSQGVTTHVTGMCGFSMAPVNPKTLPMLKGSLELLTKTFPDEMETFTTFENFFKYSQTVKRPENTQFILGHVTLRVAVMGYDNREPSPEELEQMKALLREAMEHGAAGFSTGLVYVPSAYAKLDEIIELCKVVAEYDGVYTTHMRTESDDTINAINEAIAVARATGVRTCISHHKLQGRQNWGRSVETLALIQSAIDEGLRITCDQYPYTACMTHLSVCVPPKYYTNGLAGVCDLLQDPEMKKQIYAEMNDPATPYENYYLCADGWKGVFISAAPNTPEAEGKFVQQIADEKGIDGYEVFCDLMIKNNGVCTAIYFSMGEEDVFRIIQNDFVIVGSDGIVKSGEDKAHPRAYATFPRAICYFVKENKLMSLEKMVRKMTGLTADIHYLHTKGYVKDGYDADLVVIDYDNLKDTADFVNPNALADGIDYVINAGEVIYHDKKLTGAMPGKSIYFNEK